MKKIGLLFLALLLVIIAACALEQAPVIVEPPSIPEVVYVTDNPHYNPPDIMVSPYPEQITHIPSYLINFDIDPSSRLFSGVLQVDFVNTSFLNLNRIYFNVHPAVDISAAIINFEHFETSRSNSFLRIYLQDTLAPGETLNISLFFDGRITGVSNVNGSNDHAIWLGELFPTLAVVDNNGWHRHLNLAATSNFLINMNLPSNFNLVSTGSGSSIQGADVTQFTVDTIMKRNFAFAALSESYNEQSMATSSGNDITLHYNSVLEPGGVLDSVLTTAVRAMEHFEDLIAINPHRGLRIVEVNLATDFQSYSNIIFLNSSHMRLGLANVSVAQAVARQWLHNILGGNSELEPWLTHDLADFLALELMLTRNQLSRHIGELNRDSGAQTRGIVFFYVLRNEMGQENFREFLRAYYNRYAFEIATTAGMMAVAHDFGVSSDFFYTWLLSDDLPELP